eukprot:SAG11_NODE_3228_length_2596_cov_2.794954_2_plen_47_part_00
MDDIEVELRTHGRKESDSRDGVAFSQAQLKELDEAFSTCLPSIVSS